MAANPDLSFSITQAVFNDSDVNEDVMRAAIARNPETVASGSVSPRVIEDFQSLLAGLSRWDLAFEGSTTIDARDLPNPLRSLTGEEFLAREDWQLA
ncbi:hypothetical protein NY486_04650, partial [Enterobacter hormaechei]|nr:hypothetical protein [Enterobacter hormaechei]